MFTITLKDTPTTKAKVPAHVNVLKTQTVITYQHEGKEMFDLEQVTNDIDSLGLGSAELMKVVVDFGELNTSKHTGRLVNRSNPQLARIGIVGQELPWDQDGGKVIYTFTDKTGEDIFAICFLFRGLVMRSTKALSYTQHPLTLYDLKQAVGIVQGIKEEDIECQMAGAWMDNILAGVVEAEKAALKAKRDKAKAAKAAAASAEKAAGAADGAKAAPKTKAGKKGKGKAKKAAPKAEAPTASLTIDPEEVDEQ